MITTILIIIIALLLAAVVVFWLALRATCDFVGSFMDGIFGKSWRTDVSKKKK